MVGVVGIGLPGPTLIAATSAVVAVAAGTLFRPVATLAVLLTVVVIALSDPAPTLAGAVGFTFAGLVATACPLQLPWLPLLAPLAVFAVYLLATRPFLRN